MGSNFNVDLDINHNDIVTSIKNLEHELNNIDFPNSTKNEIRSDICKILHSTYKKSSHVTYENRVFLKKINETKLFLKHNKDLFFTHADKGNITVCLNKFDYKEKMLQLLNDESTYKKVHKNPLKTLQSNSYKILQELNSNGFLHKNFHKNFLTQTNTMLSKAYGLPKIHKIDVPLRPIISTINSPTHFLSKLLYETLKNIFPKPDSYVNNSFSFKNEITYLYIPDEYMFMSLDVTSLFTNIPYNLVIQSLMRRSNLITQHSIIPLHYIISITEFLFDNTFFQFDDKFYKQIEGTPMGSPISPIFADLVMTDLECDCWSKLNTMFNIVPLIYKRYVDDSFLCVKSSDIYKIIDVFNNADTRLKFTYELESDCKINFLDLTIIRECHKIVTDWYQKPTSSGRVLNFFSNHPVQLKKNIIFNLIDRAILLSDKQFHHKNIRLVKEILINNNYEQKFITKFIRKRLFKIYNVEPMNVQKTVNDKKERFMHVSIPYNSYLFDRLGSLVKKFNITFIPLVNKKLTNIIKKGKDKTKILDNTNVVYKIKCTSCPSIYIGETKRCLSIRINEHKNKKDVESVVSTHAQNHVFDWDNITILDKESNFKKRLISEMVHINSHDNTLNKKEDVDKLNGIYRSLLFKIQNNKH